MHVATDWSHNDEPKGFACTDKSENGELKDSHLARDGTENDMLKDSHLARDGTEYDMLKWLACSERWD